MSAHWKRHRQKPRAEAGARVTGPDLNGDGQGGGVVVQGVHAGLAEAVLRAGHACSLAQFAEEGEGMVERAQVGAVRACADAWLPVPWSHPVRHLWAED
ncbi:hypothetical protein [Lentzea sp. NPDC051838]|uniref:hypothetical protein n=1 Tax=Lentzea sp. NPDC051838 TaxID=3154849 RepID=UPI00341AFD52